MFVDCIVEGKKVKAIQIGRYIVFSCCVGPDGNGGVSDMHAVANEQTKVMLMCHLTQRAAVMLADTLSIYGSDDEAMARVPVLMVKWIASVDEQIARGEEPGPYARYHETVKGFRPSLPIYWGEGG